MQLDSRLRGNYNVLLTFQEIFQQVCPVYLGMDHHSVKRKEIPGKPVKLFLQHPRNKLLHKLIIVLTFPNKNAAIRHLEFNPADK